MSHWLHPMCFDCWTFRMKDRPPVQVLGKEDRPERCCFCGKKTNGERIYVREHPDVPVYHYTHLWMQE